MADTVTRIPRAGIGERSVRRRDALGALVDFNASDGVVGRLNVVMDRDDIDGTVAVAAIVNRSDRLVPIPTFTAHRLNGESAVLARADQDARFASADVPGAGSYVPAAGALVYLVMPGTQRDVVRIRMRVGIETETTLERNAPTGEAGLRKVKKPECAEGVRRPGVRHQAVT